MPGSATPVSSSWAREDAATSPVSSSAAPRTRSSTWPTGQCSSSADLAAGRHQIMTARACVLQHIRCEPPGIFAGLLSRHGIAIETVELDEGGRLSDWREVALVLAMGGLMGVNDEAALPWLAGEKRWIAAAVR